MTIHQFIEETSREWVTDFIANRIDTLRTKKIKATGELARSMEYEIRQSAVAEGVELLLAFEEYGRLVDMRRINPHEVGRSTIEALIGYVKEKGVQNFVRGFTRRRKYLPKSREKLLQQIAWGIAKKRARGKRKRKAWYNRAKSAGITDLYNQIAAGLLGWTAEEMNKQF